MEIYANASNGAHTKKLGEGKTKAHDVDVVSLVEIIT